MSLKRIAATLLLGLALLLPSSAAFAQPVEVPNLNLLDIISDLLGGDEGEEQDRERGGEEDDDDQDQG